MLDGRIAIVTGAGSGPGEAIAILFDGWDKVIAINLSVSSVKCVP